MIQVFFFGVLDPCVMPYTRHNIVYLFGLGCFFKCQDLWQILSLSSPWQTSLTPEQQRYAVVGVPTLLEVCGFSYYYGGFLVGPQFSMCKYRQFVTGELTDVEGQRPNRLVY